MLQQCNVCSPEKNHQDAIALSNLAHRSMDALEHEFVILSELIFRQTNVTAQLEKELEHVKHVKLGVHDLTKGKLSPGDILQSSLRQGQDILSNKFTQFHIYHKDPLHYYSQGDFIFTRLHSHLYLTLKIPISPYVRPVAIYKSIFISCSCQFFIKSCHATP